MLGISIIIPCYKREKELEKCLKFLLRSKALGKNFDYEILIIENSEKQKLRNLISEFKNLKLRYFWLKKKGIAKAKNFGAKKSRYKILCFCDSDIKVEKNTLWKTILTLKNNSYAAMVSGNLFWQGTKRIDRPQKTDRFFKYKRYIFAECFYGRYIACFKRAFLKVGGFDDKLFNMRGEGVDLSLKFWRAGYPLLFNPEIKIFHTKEASLSVTRAVPEKNSSMFNSIAFLLYKYQSDLKNSPYHSSSLYLWTKKLFGKFVPFLILEAWSKSLESIAKNYKDIIKSRKKIPQRYNFKPFEIFSKQNRQLLAKCLKAAPERLKKYKK